MPSVGCERVAFSAAADLDSSDTPALAFEPGEGTSPLAITQFDGLSALRIANTMVPDTVVATGPNGTLRGATVQLIR